MLYPLKFVPRFVEKIWGGRKIETVLGKPLPPGKHIGESWEIYDFPPGVCGPGDGWTSAPVANGPLAGMTLHQLIEQFGPDLLGSVAPVGPHKQFPLLIKFLDAREDLSVQVHPDEQYAASHPGAHLKTEAWCVIDSDANSRIYKGLRPGTTRELFRQSIEQAACERWLASIPVHAGDCHFLPSGTVHALGAGILVAEVQTPSDTTFRVYDFNRMENGRPRQLHIEQALECIDFSAATQLAANVDRSAGDVGPLITSPYFRIDERETPAGESVTLSGAAMRIWIILEGELQIRSNSGGGRTPAKKGETILLPAKMPEASASATYNSSWLEVSLPEAKRSAL